MHNTPRSKRRFGLAIHGGAGTLPRGDMPPERAAKYHAALEQALDAGFAILSAGGASLDAVCAAVVALEDCPLFNAGHGAVFNAAGEHELDAAVMDGGSLAAGAVAGLRVAKNPVLVARGVMEQTPHVLLAGAGADAFAQAQNYAVVTQEYFSTAERWSSLQHIQARERQGGTGAPLSEAEKHGTVGAVACDGHGNLAAATSTGGYTNKMMGRVGDSPLIGAGTYADNRSCAVSATGHGESFIRLAAARDIAALMEYRGLTLEQATRQVVMKKLKRIGGSGGVIAIDRHGHIAMPFNAQGMYRGYARADGTRETAIYRKRNR